MWETQPGTSQQGVVSNLLWRYPLAYVFRSIWSHPPWTVSCYWPAPHAIAFEFHQERQSDPPMRDWQLCTHPPFAVVGEWPEHPIGREPNLQHVLTHASNPIGESGTRGSWLQFFWRPRMCWYSSQSTAGPVLFTIHRCIVPWRWM